eukprot:Gb_08794 [translate_table: standard]
MELASQYPYSSYFQHYQINHKNVHSAFFVSYVDIDDAGFMQAFRKGKRQTKWKSDISNVNTVRGQALLKDIHANTNACAYTFHPQACTNIKEVKRFHARIFRRGLEQDILLGTKLVSMYDLCDSMDNARRAFDRVQRQDVFLWNMMIKGYARNGPYEEAVALYYQMLWSGIQPNNFTFPFVLKACASLSSLQEGKKIHDHIIIRGLESDVYVGSALINMYCKCQSTEDARHVFDKMSERNVVSWTAMISGYAQNGHDNKALALFYQMQLADMKPDSVTMVSVLLACAHLQALEKGQCIHGLLIKSGFKSHVFVTTGLIDMYARCRRIKTAWQLFDNMSKKYVASWNAMIAGYSQNGYTNEAFILFNKMQVQDVKPDPVTMLCVLPGCTHLSDLPKGKQIHGYIIKSGFESDVSVGNSLIHMYAKCRRIEFAHQLFDEMPIRDVVTWNAMIVGYAMHGHAEDVLSLFAKMQKTSTKPNHITFVSILSACSNAGLVDKGWEYFDCMSQYYDIAPQVEHYACMVDLLGRAGRLVEAVDFIEQMPLEPSASVWGSLFDACRVRGNIELGQSVAERLLELEPENADCYVLLSNVYAVAGRWNDLEKVRTKMKDMVT